MADTVIQPPAGATATRPPDVIYVPRRPAILSYGVVTQMGETQQKGLQAKTMVQMPTPRVRPEDIDREVVWAGVVLLTVVVLGALVTLRAVNRANLMGSRSASYAPSRVGPANSLARHVGGRWPALYSMTRACRLSPTWRTQAYPTR